MTSTLASNRVPGAVGGLLAGLGFFGGIAAAKATEKSEYPRPGSSPEVVQNYFTESATPARMSVAGLAVSTWGLAKFTGAVARLSGRSGAGSRALAAAAVAGGGFAVVTQAVSAMATAANTSKDNHPQTTADLRQVSYLVGGPVHGVGYGILSGALGVAALKTGRLPKPLAIASVVTAPIGILGPLALLKKEAMMALPIGHMLSLLISGAAGVQLARRPR
jgi:hypothetical protein